MSASAKNLLVLGACVSVLLLTVILEEDGTQVTLLGWRVPAACSFRFTPLACCPGCGLTRSLIAFGHHEVMRSFRLHPAGGFLWCVVLLLTLLTSVRIVSPARSPATKPFPALAAGLQLAIRMVLVISLFQWIPRIVSNLWMVHA